MPPELTIGSIATPVQSGPRGNIPTATRPVAQPATVSPPSVASTSASSQTIPASRVVLDPASDRVVLEYFDSTGALVNSLPSQRQLDAYRLAAAEAPDPHNIKNT